jgi:hypothetical protein
VKSIELLKKYIDKMTQDLSPFGLSFKIDIHAKDYGYARVFICDKNNIQIGRLTIKLKPDQFEVYYIKMYKRAYHTFDLYENSLIPVIFSYVDNNKVLNEKEIKKAYYKAKQIRINRIKEIKENRKKLGKYKINKLTGEREIKKRKKIIGPQIVHLFNKLLYDQEIFI